MEAAENICRFFHMRNVFLILPGWRRLVFQMNEHTPQLKFEYDKI